MNFTYYYKTSDGVRHEAEIGAPSRDEVFAALREKGIRPIKVVSKDEKAAQSGVKKRVVFAVVFVVAIFAGIVGVVLGTHANGNAQADVVPGARHTTGRLTVVQPLPRQRIPGNRTRIESPPATLFKHPSEAFLARFAEPGSKVSDVTVSLMVETNFPAALKDPVMVATDELSEYIDLKRIVAGMKREMNAYLAGGGTVQGYVAELIKRQRMEGAYREKAEKRLKELISAVMDNPAGPDHANALSLSYAYWLKANASLQSMGIAPLLLPDELRAYQMSLDIDDVDGIPDIKSHVIESAPVEVRRK